MGREELRKELERLPKSRLVSRDLLPTTREERHISPFEFMVMWVGMSILLAVFTNAANMFPSLSIKSILCAVVLGNAITCVTLALTGDIGITHGIPFAVYLRAIYGYTGTHVPSFVRALPACFWFGFQTYLGAQAINMILMKLTSWPGTYPYVLGIIVLFLTVQAITTARGINAIKNFENLITPVMFLIVMYLLYWILNRTGLTATKILETPAGEVQGERYTFGFAVTAMTGFWATMALNIPDLTRYLKCNPDEPNWLKRNWPSIWPQWIGIIPMMTLFAFIGAAAMLTSGQWDPIRFIAGLDAPIWLLIIILFLSAFAQWTTNIGANILPPANIFVNIFAPKINFGGGCMISAILAFIMQPWSIIDKVVSVNALVGIMLGGVVGTMIADYYLLRGRKLNVRDLYVEDGEYTFFKNWNPIAFIAYITGTLGGVLNMDWGFLQAGFFGGLTYFVLMRFWGAKKYKQNTILERFASK